MEKPDQQIVKDLMINTEQHAPDKHFEGNNDSMELFIEEESGSIKAPIIFGPINCLGISNPSNS